METRRLRRNIEALGDYVGQKLRENGFDPKGKREPSTLDDLVSISRKTSIPECRTIQGIGRPRLRQHPSMLEREAMILSSFAGMVLVRTHSLSDHIKMSGGHGGCDCFPHLQPFKLAVFNYPDSGLCVWVLEQLTSEGHSVSL
uniref:Uncharacterized protein n=1 Tax=Denticeps clupeoides TaxID=299321 RepID=A0AAY4BLQ1_9TELE